MLFTAKGARRQSDFTNRTRNFMIGKRMTESNSLYEASC